MVAPSQVCPLTANPGLIAGYLNLNPSTLATWPVVTIDRPDHNQEGARREGVLEQDQKHDTAAGPPPVSPQLPHPQHARATHRRLLIAYRLPTRHACLQHLDISGFVG